MEMNWLFLKKKELVRNCVGFDYLEGNIIAISCFSFLFLVI